jgi:hypothetical protein
MLVVDDIIIFDVIIWINIYHNLVIVFVVVGFQWAMF